MVFGGDDALHYLSFARAHCRQSSFVGLKISGRIGAVHPQVGEGVDVEVHEGVIIES